MSKLLLFIIVIINTYNCASSSIGGDKKKSAIYLTSENGKIYRTERNPKTFYLKAKGPVIFSCSTPICTSEELEAVPPAKIKELIRQGLWEEYSTKELDGQDGLAEEEKKYKSFKIRQGEYQENLKVGKWLTMREDGSTLLESEFVKDKKNGFEYKFGLKGQIVETSFYKDGLREGDYIEKTEKGLTREKGQYANGKRVGFWSVYYLTDEKGKELTTEIQKEILECKDDLRNGKYTKFNFNGSKSEEATFVDGKRNGLVVFYYPSGEMKSEGKYEPVPPKPNSNIENYNKSLMQCAEMEEGSGGEVVNKKAGDWKEYYPNGQIYSIGKFDGGAKVGEWKYYSSKGVLRVQGKMKNLIIFDEGKLFNEDGVIEGDGRVQLSILTMDEKIFELKHSYKPGIPFKYYKNGKLTLEVSSDKDGNTFGIKYDDNGQLIGKGPIVNGKENDCWMMKDNSKKYFMMGNENKKMGDMQNCK
jgi:antitoxin component YwqK of YwqJK toxin-antitoxin module